MRNYKNWLQAYMKYTSLSESPGNFHFWTGVSTIAGVLRRQVWIDQRIFQWVPNFYIILVGPPGVAAKSTTIRQGMALLEKVPTIRFGPQSVTWQSLFDAFAEATMAIKMPDQSVVPMACLTIPIGELGTFFRPDNKDMVDFLVAMWDGQKEVFSRSTRKDGEMKITNPWLNLIAATTPSWLRENVPEIMIGGGLTSRIIFVHGYEKRRLVAYPSQEVEVSAFAEMRRKLTEDLMEIAKLRGEFIMTPEAITWGAQWYEKHHREPDPRINNDRFAGYHARKQTHLHKLAMIYSVAKRSDLLILPEDLRDAELSLRNVENDMLAVFENFGKSQTGRILEVVYETLKNRSNRTMLLSELWRLCQSRFEQQQFAQALNAGVQSQDLSYIKTSAGIYIRLIGETAHEPDLRSLSSDEDSEEGPLQSEL